MAAPRSRRCSWTSPATAPGPRRRRRNERSKRPVPEGQIMMSFRRIYAMVLRHVYILRGSWTRVLEMAYWPAVNMVVWGFTSQFFRGHSDWVAQAGGVLIGAVLLWDVM